ncbi:hypothetical protein COOONC_22209 [Cooperia oncophora]
MCVRYAFRFIVIAAVLFCLWYSLTHNIQQLRACDNLPSPLYVHPVHSTADSPAVPREPHAAFAPRIRLLPHSLCETNATVVFVIHSDVRNIAQRQFQRKQLDDAWLETAQAWVQLLSSCPEAPAFIIKLDDDVMVDRIGVEYLIDRFVYIPLPLTIEKSFL